jgi:UDP-2-acetamido-2-deoxy-ribo-hexuluronate aminotransferase
MHKIQMVDLKSQYDKIADEVDQAIKEVITNSSFINGPSVKEFKADLEQYLNVKHVIPCGNGTDALQIALMSLNLKPGDEIITSTFTFIATAEVITLLGLTPVFVDVDKNNYNISVEEIKKNITSKTKVILPVHLYGQCAPMEEILSLAKLHNLHVIEDTAQAIGAKYKFKDGSFASAGTMGHIGTTSFFPSKNLGCYGDGGAIFTNNDELAQKMSMIVNHGSKIKYHHEIIGLNSRLDSIQAAVLKIKLPLLNSYCEARLKAALQYNEGLKNIEWITTPLIMDYSTHVFHQYTMQVNNGRRDELKEYLANKGISSMVYYPIPLHQQKAFKSFNQNTKFPVSDKLQSNVLSLPIHTELNEETINFIIESLKEFK